ncbi:MAG TPA: DNA (cytosine-5-)-methyltransferase [Sideroxyarcus sp.]|nr:DNA (cytosine-5-)-methyltransferase [Sideroxyarcus sp.]
MRYLSVCSGIEAATCAWHPLGWQPAAFSEIEKFPRQVLAHHYPHVPLHGDFTTIKGDEYGAVELLVGGTPCQSFSVAGLRKGLDDPRGNLMLTYLAIADKYRPTWLVWENVPGVLSSNGGRDFGTFLGGLGKLGYGFSYRVLDAQYVRTDGYPYAVPQRRRRVFVVGHLGGWQRAAAVLFDSESLRGNPPPRREAGKAVASKIKSCLDVGCAGTLTAGFGKVGAPEVDAYTCIPTKKWPAETSSCMNAHFGDKQGLEDQHINQGAPMFTEGNGGMVRRLTPKECARLQGFPDDYLSQVPGYSDSAAYKAFGNSMAVNVMQIIGKRIQMVSEIPMAQEIAA